MDVLADPARRLRLVLRLVALHSAAVGVGMIWRPADLLGSMGYAPICEPFFPVQGGIFHVIMALGYFLAARDLEANRSLVVFAVLVKTVATVFLLTYWLLVVRIPVVLLSGIGDGIMALLIGIGYGTWRRRQTREAGHE